MGHVGHTASVQHGATGQVDGTPDLALVVRAGPLLCALRLQDVIETMRPLPVQPLAGLAPFVRGVSIVRGVPTPVIDVALLVGGHAAPTSRYVAVHAGRGPVALATGDVLGIRAIDDAGGAGGDAAVLGGACTRAVAAVATFESRPLLVLQSMRLLADDIWPPTTAGAS